MSQYGPNFSKSRERKKKEEQDNWTLFSVLRYHRTVNDADG